MKVHFDPPTALKMALLTMMPTAKPTAKPLFWKRLRAQGQDTFELCIPRCSLCLSVLGISSLESDVGMKTKVPALRFRHQFRSSSYECRDPMEFPCQVDSRHSSFDIQHPRLKNAAICLANCCLKNHLSRPVVPTYWGMKRTDRPFQSEFRG